MRGITGTERDDRQKIRRHFFHTDALPDDFRGKLRLSQFLPVLSLHLRDVDVGSDLKRQLDRHVAVIGAGGIVVEEIIDSRQLHLDRPCHRIRDHFGAGAGIVGINLNDRRRDFWKLRDRQPP